MDAAICRHCGTEIERDDPSDFWEHAEEAPADSPCWDGNAPAEPIVGSLWSR